jgi:UDP-N-acetylmuramoylalanine-D-glutamate ligase
VALSSASVCPVDLQPGVAFEVIVVEEGVSSSSNTITSVFGVIDAKQLLPATASLFAVTGSAGLGTARTTFFDLAAGLPLAGLAGNAGVQIADAANK